VILAGAKPRGAYIISRLSSLSSVDPVFRGVDRLRGIR
jgi:hypothetical protein